MRKKLVTLLTAGALGAAAVLVALTAAAQPAMAAGSDPYRWKNVQIVGGGFVPGIIFNPSQQNLVYARTDIGGAYRWDQAAGRWLPLLDWVGFTNWNLNGVASLATDPVDPNRVYVAAGMYTNSWDPNNGAILRSADKGATWAVSPLPFKVGGNMPGRGMGERLAIDPNRNSVLYFGAPEGRGMWRSTDSGVSWSQVVSFPNAGNYVQDPSDPFDYLTHNQGVVWVAFDKSTGTPGSPTQGIYVGVADLQNTVYRSTDGGATWSRIAGQPTGFLAHQGQVDPVNHALYITTSDKGGPYDGGRGDVWKYSTTTGAWTRISPVPSTDTNNDWFGYSGLSIDRQHPNTLMVTGYSSWYPDTFIFRSTDGGATWRTFYEYAWPSRTDHYTLDISAAPWLTFGVTRSLPEESPKLGWMTEALAIDPFNSDRFMYGTGATIYGSTNLTALDSGGTVDLRVMAQGLEETAVNDLVSPPGTGAPLLSALGDLAGFRHTNLDAVPAKMYTTPFFNTTGIDFAETNPNVVVRVGSVDKAQNPGTNRVGISFDNGVNWFQGSEPPGVTGGGTVAVAAGGNRMVWAPDGAAVSVSSDGNSWTAATGVPSGAQVRSDRVNANKFYAFRAGTFYVSTNGGQTFTATAASGLPGGGNVHVKAVPGIEGDLWLAGGDSSGAYGLWHSTNSGASFTRLTNVTRADNVGFGRPAPGLTYPALYTIAQIDGVRGIFRSDNAGAAWVRINDDAHQWGNIGAAITGDPRIYGRVYVGTNGRGIQYGDRAGDGGGGGDTTPPTAPGTPTASNVTASSVVLSWTASTDNVGVTGYDVVRVQGTTETVVASPAGTSATIAGLAANTAYTFAVYARDAAGNRSARSGTVTVTTAGGTSGGCAVTYAVNSWGGSFQGDVTIRNNGTSAINGWTLSWTFVDGQTVFNIWNGGYVQTGGNVSVTNLGYNATIAAGGGTVTFGFQAHWNDVSNTRPAVFSLNGTACTVS
jgi:xyloglucan-specific exo-beta-1,4-glucanase